MNSAVMYLRRLAPDVGWVGGDPEAGSTRRRSRRIGYAEELANQHALDKDKAAARLQRAGIGPKTGSRKATKAKRVAPKPDAGVKRKQVVSVEDIESVEADVPVKPPAKLSKVDTETGSKAAPEPVAEPESVPAPASAPEAEQKLEAEPEPEPEPEPEVEPKDEVETKAKSVVKSTETGDSTMTPAQKPTPAKAAVVASAGVGAGAGAGDSWLDKHAEQKAFCSSNFDDAIAHLRSEHSERRPVANIIAALDNESKRAAIKNSLHRRAVCDNGLGAPHASMYCGGAKCRAAHAPKLVCCAFHPKYREHLNVCNNKFCRHPRCSECSELEKEHSEKVGDKSLVCKTCSKVVPANHLRDCRNPQDRENCLNCGRV